MASVELPSTPGPRAVAWQAVDFGGTLQGPLGGAGQRVNRPGNRWRALVEMPEMTPAQARAWAAALTQGLRLGVIWKIRQVGLPVGAPGMPLVAGASQAGSTLAVDGLTPAYGWRPSQWITVETGGRGYLYQLSASGTADTAGEADLPVEPPLRVSPADNDPIEIAAPYIEGLLEGAPGWQIDARRLVNGFAFSVIEVR